MKFTKEDEGNIIFAKPTGNAARYDKDKIVKFEVVKVKRKYVEMYMLYGDDSKSYSTDNYSPESGATQKEINSGYGGNSGYIFFRYEKDIKNHTELLVMRRKMRDFFSYGSNKISLEDAKIIVAIIEKETT